MYFRFCNKRPHIEIQLSVSIFRPTYLLLSACHSASAYQTSFELNHPTPVVVMTSYQFFKMAVIESEIYFRFRFWWWYSLGKMEIYWHTKFRWDVSIHGWDKTTSGFGKRTAAILDFYFRFLFLPNFRHRRIILHWPTIFRQNRTTLVKMVEHLSNAVHWHAIHAWWTKTSILHMAPKRPDTMADTVIDKFVRNR